MAYIVENFWKLVKFAIFLDVAELIRDIIF